MALILFLALLLEGGGGGRFCVCFLSPERKDLRDFTFRVIFQGLPFSLLCLLVTPYLLQSAAQESFSDDD